jgi:hypothetical protein
VKHCSAVAKEQMETLKESFTLRRQEEVRADRARRRAEFLADKTAAYGQYLELARFAEFPKSIAHPDGAGPADQMFRELLRIVAERRKTFDPENLAAEVLHLELFADEDSDCELSHALFIPELMLPRRAGTSHMGHQRS